MNITRSKKQIIERWGTPDRTGNESEIVPLIETCSIRSSKKSFINCKYTLGGKSYKGIDCSALVQLYYLYNNKFFPRDTKDQISFKKGKKKIIKFSRGDIIYWKGHVAVCLNRNKLIHAYGPRKKVLIMNIKKTVELINETAKLKVKKIIKI